jgi:hypothetical protein
MGKSIEVILLDDVPELGRSGDACRVRSGYARNFLFPQKLAVTMTPGTKRLIEKKRAEAVVRLAKEKEEAEALLQKLEKLVLTCSVKANADGRLFAPSAPPTCSRSWPKPASSCPRSSWRCTSPSSRWANTKRPFISTRRCAAS